MIDLFTVVFSQDLFLLPTQAKSIELYIDSSLINKIFVIVNDVEFIVDFVDKSWWGINSNKVTILHCNELAAHPTRLKGWSSQQLYKILAAAQSQTKWSMCLDAKTFFCKKLDLDLLFDSQGRVRFIKFPIQDEFKSAKNLVENLYNIEVPYTVGPGGVPFMFHNSDVREMIKDIELRTGDTFYNFFVENVEYPIGLTEFVLYSGFIESKYGTLDLLYADNQPYIIINIADFQIDQFDTLVRCMGSDGPFTISIHRRVYTAVTKQQVEDWLNVVHSFGLIGDVKNNQIWDKYLETTNSQGVTDEFQI